MLQIVGGWVGRGKFSFQCLRPSASLRAADKNCGNFEGTSSIKDIFIQLKILAAPPPPCLPSKLPQLFYFISNVFCNPINIFVNKIINYHYSKIKKRKSNKETHVTSNRSHKGVYVIDTKFFTYSH
jgi:hypothetical protein